MSVFGNTELFEEFENAEKSEASSDSESDDNVEDEYKEKYRNLKHENEKLKKSLRLLERPVDIKIKDASTDGPVAHVILFNNIIARKHREEIKDFFYDLSNRRSENDGDSTLVTEPQPSFIQYTSSSKQHRHKKSSRRVEATTKAFQAFSSIQVFKKFYIDQLGEPLSFEDPAFSDWFLPQYEQLSFEPMSGDPNDAMQRKRKKLQRICFNCGGSDHQIKDCEKSRDHQAINERRQKFMDEVAKYSDGSPQIRLDGPRYHQDDEVDSERFASFRPGVISANLQEALGITEENIPPYIYQMRKLGYPPGHLSNARITKSGLAMYENSEEDGKDKENAFVPVNIEKIIGYPGFNLPPLPGQEDKFNEHCVAPMNEAQSKEVMVSYFEHRNNLYNQRKNAEEKAKDRSKKEKIKKSQDMDMEEVDMEMGDDIDDDNPDVQSHTTVTHSPMTRTEESDLEDGEVDDIEADVGSLTEDELEIKREMLLKELGKASDTNKNDSDYRNIKSNDQDYRITTAEIIDLTGNTSESDVNQTVTVIEEETEIYSETETMVVLSSTDETDDAENVVMKERSTSSDTDYRMKPTFLSPHSRDNSPPLGYKTELTELVDNKSEDTPENQGPVEMVKQEQSGSSELVCDESTSLPNRQKFAKGITQFDAYYSESKSRGVYKKLRTLLKDSPRRQDKDK